MGTDMNWKTINEARVSRQTAEEARVLAATAEREAIYKAAFESAEVAIQPTLWLAAQSGRHRVTFDPDTSPYMHHAARAIPAQEVTRIQIEAVTDWLRSWVDAVKVYERFVSFEIGPDAWAWIAQQAEG